jgi:hypothetical protein
MKKIELDGEIADKITILNLQDYLNYLQKELDDFDNGNYMHDDDIAHSVKIIPALKMVIREFGGDIDE